MTDECKQLKQATAMHQLCTKSDCKHSLDTAADDLSVAARKELNLILIETCLTSHSGGLK
jgi:hypothetical protein